jgi:hypothetical protein
MRILTVGLHAAGKTTILYELTLGDLLGEIVTTIPTIRKVLNEDKLRDALLLVSMCYPSLNRATLRV